VEPAINYEQLIRHITHRFVALRSSARTIRTRMVGIVFAPPNSTLASSEIIPRLRDWHFRSGQHIDFYFAGYTYLQPPPHPLGYETVSIPGTEPWLYSAELFDKFRHDLGSQTSWRYGGECELLLTNSGFDFSTSQAYLDFTSTIVCRLDRMRTDEAFPSVSIFFEKVFRFAEETDDPNPTWGFSDAEGMGCAGSALKDVVLSFLPTELRRFYKGAEHVAVRDIGLPRREIDLM
jgi:hypothetical protein